MKNLGGNEAYAAAEKPVRETECCCPSKRDNDPFLRTRATPYLFFAPSSKAYVNLRQQSLLLRFRRVLSTVSVPWCVSRILGGILSSRPVRPVQRGYLVL